MYHEYYDMYNVYADYVREDFIIKSTTPKDYGQYLMNHKKRTKRK